MLVHIGDVSSASGRDPIEDFDTIREELRLHDAALAAKPHIVAANKIDALDEPARLERLLRHVGTLGLQAFAISGVTGEGLNDLLEAMWREIASARAAEVDLDAHADVDETIDLITPGRLRRDA